MIPTNVSRSRKGNDTKTGTRNATTDKRTSPAKMFPNNLNANDSMRENSEITSKIPTKKDIGLEKLKNLPR